LATPQCVAERRRTILSCVPAFNARLRYDPSLPLAFAVAGLFKCRIEDIFVPD